MCRFGSSSIRVSVALITMMTAALPAKAKALNEIRTYMPFTFPIEPAKLHTIPDINIAFALNSTLVERDDEKEISSGLAESWRVVTPKVYRFTLDSNAKWSNGTPILALDVKRSIERTLKIHPDEMGDIVQILDSIACPSTREIDFKLKIPVHKSKLLEKLTDPKFGIIKIQSNGQLDFTVTSGSFSVLPKSNFEELTLVRNPSFHHKSETGLVDRIIIRRMPKNEESPTALLVDQWPNFMESTSLSQSGLEKKYQEAGFSIWTTPLDKLFYFQLGRKNATPEGRALLRYLRSKIKVPSLVTGLSGYSETSQMFPRGYELYDPEFSCPKDKSEFLPIKYSRRPVNILISPARISSMVKENISRFIFQATGIAPHFISVPLEQVYSYRVTGDFDLYIGVVGLAEPDPDTLLSFHMGGDIPLIFTRGTNLLKRLTHAKSLNDNKSKLKEIRSLLRDAQCEGHILPLFHLSTIGIARSEIDFSLLSESDESVRLSKIRFNNISTNSNEEIARGTP